jgi:hypothetical protein
LDAIVNGSTEEARAGKITWKDVQVDEFVRFCEWIYREDYTAKDTKGPQGSESRYCGYEGCPGEDFEPLLLAHARLYVFATDHFIELLRELAASKFNNMLHEPDPCTCHIQAVLALAQYVYSDDAERRSRDRLDYIRSVAMESVMGISRIR